MRDEEEINEQLNRAAAAAEKGGTRYRGMTYEQGVEEALLWVTENTNEPPIPEDQD